MAGPEQFGRLNLWAILKKLAENNLGPFTNAGAPTDGASGTFAEKAGPGALLFDFTNKKLYVNTNTLASPTWEVADIASVTGDVTFSAAGVAALAAQIINGVDLGNVANVNVIGGVPVIHRITAAALTGDIDVILTHKTRITHVHCIATAAGAAADTITVKNGATAITNAMDLNVADLTVVRVGTIDDAQWEIAAGGTLRITGASAVNAEVVVEGIRVA